MEPSRFISKVCLNLSFYLSHIYRNTLSFSLFSLWCESNNWSINCTRSNNYKKQDKEDSRGFHTTPSKASKISSSNKQFWLKFIFNVSSMTQDENGVNIAWEKSNNLKDDTKEKGCTNFTKNVLLFVQCTRKHDVKPY